MFTREYLRSCTREIENRLFCVEQGLSKCPDGMLVKEYHRGKIYLIHEVFRNKQRKRRSLTKDPQFVELLLRKAALLEEERCLRASLEVINNARKSIKDFDATDFIKRYSAQFENIDEEIFLKALHDPTSDAWASAPYDNMVWRSDEKIHVTSHGLKVRSKSELLIAEKLYEYDLPFRYEQLITLNDGNVLSPDFTIRKPNGQFHYWEHNGLTNDKNYLDRQQTKTRLYAAANIVPWKNLIITYDDENGSIDLRQIESEIESKLL